MVKPRLRPARRLCRVARKPARLGMLRQAVEIEIAKITRLIEAKRLQRQAETDALNP